MAEISEKMVKALNEQIKKELESAYIYLGMSSWFAERTLNNLAKWFDLQAKEEFEHAMKFANHIMERGGHVEWMDISKPKQDWENILQILEAGLEHERYITAEIEKLYELANELKEYGCLHVLKWFIEEQVEEEDSFMAIIDKYNGYHNDFNFDHHLKRED